MKSVSNRDFVKTWQASKTAMEAAEKMGLRYGSMLTRASTLRKHGVKLKKFATRRPPDEPLDVAELNKLCR